MDTVAMGGEGKDSRTAPPVTVTPYSEEAYKLWLVCIS